MGRAGVFEAVVRPSLDRVAGLEVRHTELSGSREVVLSHVIRRNVFTEFDSKLSRHLAATTGLGFPAVAVGTRWRAQGTGEPWRTLEETEFASVPHALDAIARRALHGRETAVLRLHHHDLCGGERTRDGERRLLSTDDLRGLERALEICALFGEPPFLEISGDFDLVVASMPESGLGALMADLATGRISAGGAGGLEPVSGALYETDRLFGSEGAGRVYLAAMRRAAMQAKQDAVLDFRAAAEQRILDFDAALKGRALSGHRLEAACSLVWRLKAGLGESLAGLSEHAQLTAFDWQAEIESEGGTGRDVWAAPGGAEERARAYA